jgi:uncharacterized membrane protein
MNQYRLNFIANLLFWLIVSLILSMPDHLGFVKWFLLIIFVPYYLIRSMYVDHFSDQANLEYYNKQIIKKEVTNGNP